MKTDDGRAGRGAGVSIERAQRGNGVIAGLLGSRRKPRTERKTNTRTGLHAYRIVSAWVDMGTMGPRKADVGDYLWVGAQRWG
jgi:hypothetical protein